MSELEQSRARSRLLRLLAMHSAVSARPLPRIDAKADLLAVWEQYRVAVQEAREAATLKRSGELRLKLVLIFLWAEALGVRAGLPLAGFALRQVGRMAKYDSFLPVTGGSREPSADRGPNDEAAAAKKELLRRLFSEVLADACLYILASSAPL